MKLKSPALIRRLTRDHAVMAFFVIFSILLAFWQAPGRATADTKIDLHVDPAQFLKSVASVWTPTTDLGNVHASQYSGYLWPMGPFFYVLHAIGLGSWPVERIWLAALFALAAWGTVRLVDVLVGRPRGAVHLVAGAFYVLNPFVVVSVARSSIDLLGYASLPWLLLITYHGVHAHASWRSWRSWWWAAAFALILASTGGGVNAALIAWVLLGPLVLAIYEPLTRAVRWRASIGFLLRVGVLGLLTSLWWIAPALAHVHYGIDFLRFTEQPSTIWATNSGSEALRLMGFWNSYSGVGYGVVRPLFSDAGSLLFNPLVVGAGLLVPAIAVAATIRARRDSYAPLLMCLVLVGFVVMVAGFPNGTPLRGAMVWIYDRSFILRFLRTNHKVAPLVAIGLAGLLGIAAQQLLDRAAALGSPRLRRIGFGAVGAGFSALVVFTGLPLIQGQAIDRQFQYKRIPSAWRQVGQDLNRGLATNTRALVLPGQIYAFYNWGGTGDNVLPRLTSRPVAVRYETPYSDLHAAGLLTSVDDSVQQRRLVPGQLPALLRLMGVGTVVTGSDDDLSRSGAIDPAAAAPVLHAQLGRPTKSYGPAYTFQPAAGDVGPAVALPEVQRYDLPAPRGLVHVDPTQNPTIVDGGPQGLVQMAAFGALPDRNAIFYAGDVSRAFLQSQAAGGANLVVTDSNRRSVFVPEFSTQNQGPVLAADQPFPAETATLDPFPVTNTNDQTVAELQGARYVTTPVIGGSLQFPEHAAVAAFDGNTSTSWVASTLLPLTDAWVQIGFDHPRDVPYVDIQPLQDADGGVSAVNVNGIRHSVGAGWTRVPVHLLNVSAIRVTIDRLRRTAVPVGSFAGFREIRIPGVHVRQLLRTPSVVGTGVAGRNLAHDSLTYDFERMTGDDPFRRNRFGASSLLNTPADRGDAELNIDRVITTPAPRVYTGQAWVYPSLLANDSALDRLAGYRGAVAFNSSGRFENQPAYRASSAFAGRPGGWIGIWRPGFAPSPWISWSTPRLLTVSHLVLRHSAVAPEYPTAVQLSWPGGRSQPLVVGADGTVVLPQPVRARSFRITVLAATTPRDTPLKNLAAWAVGIGSISVPGLPRPAISHRGRLHAACGTVSVDVAGHPVAMRPEGTIQELEGGLPVQARSCAGRVPIPAGIQEIRGVPGVFTIDRLQLRSPAPAPLASGLATGGTVVAAGSIGTSTLNGARVRLNGSAWIVLGESFNHGWQATCNGRSLGAPRVVDGYANGWLASGACRDVAFVFAPQQAVRTSYAVSVISALILIALMLAGWRRGIARVRRDQPRYRPEPVGRTSLIRAAAIAVVLAVPIGAVFAIRVGVVSAPLLFAILWLRPDRRILTGVAVFLLAVVEPVTYLITSPVNQGGYDFAYSVDLLWAHWFAVAAILLLAIVTAREIRSARRGQPLPARPSSGGVTVEESKHDSTGRVEQEVVRG